MLRIPKKMLVLAFSAALLSNPPQGSTYHGIASLPLHIPPQTEGEKSPLLFSRENIIAHRAAGGDKREEYSLRSISKAVKSGAAWIEMDLRLTSDNQLVVHHDARLGRTTPGVGYLDELTLAQLRASSGHDDEHIPTLDQVLKLVDGKAGLVLDIKSQHVAEELANLLRQHVQSRRWRYNQFIVMSFDHEEIRSMRRLNPAVPRGILVQGVSLALASTLRATAPSYVFLHKDFIRLSVVREAHRKHIKVFGYTVNNGLEMARMAEWQLDGIITDKPQSALKLSRAATDRKLSKDPIPTGLARIGDISPRSEPLHITIDEPRMVPIGL